MKQDPCLLALDCGLTATKALIFDPEGRVLAEGRCATEVKNRAGRSELDMEVQWRNAAAAIRSAVASGSFAPEAVRCVAVSGHGAGLYAVDDRLRPAGPALTSMDTRAEPILRERKERGAGHYELTRHEPWAGQPIVQLAWLRREEPALYRRIRWVLSAKDWAVLRLTGTLSADLTDASNSGFVNINTKSYDERITDGFGIPEVAGMLPQLALSTKVVAGVSEAAAEETGLAAGTPVASGLFDVIACALGSGVYDEQRLSIIAGTWNINTAIDTRLVEVAPSVKCSLSADGESFAYVESSATSAVNFEWFVQTFVSGDSPEGRYREAIEAAAAQRPSAEDPFYLPYLHSSHLDSGRGAGFFGLRPEHGMGHAARAVLEGVCFAHRAHLEILRSAGSGLGREVAVLSGGASHSEYWASLFADVLGIQLELTDCAEAGALGAAIVAAVGADIYRSVAEAAAAMVRISSTFEPKPEGRRFCSERFERFRELSR
jgi:L-xylulokinase